LPSFFPSHVDYASPSETALKSPPEGPLLAQNPSRFGSTPLRLGFLPFLIFLSLLPPWGCLPSLDPVVLIIVRIFSNRKQTLFCYSIL